MVSPLTTGKNVYLTITTALGKDAFILNKFEGTEGFCSLFEFKAELYATHVANASNNDIDFTALLQESATIAIQFQYSVKYISGIVTRFTQGSTVAVTDPQNYRQQERTYYYLTLRPKLWLATLRENCKIFQNMATLDIIKEVLGDHSITIMDNTSSAGQTVREYCVQYNESDFQFISRLMEAEGIYYFFAHLAGDHILVLCDASTTLQPNSEVSLISNIQNANEPSAHLAGLFDLRVCQELVSSIYTTQDYDFEKPTAPLKATSQGEGTDQEVYNYPGNYVVQTDGTKISDRRLTAIEFPFAYCTGRTNIPLLQVGTTFTLTNCPRQTENKKDFAIYEIQHEGKQAETNEDLEQSLYSNKVTFFHKIQPYSPPLKTPRPKIYGTQTAIVTGKAGEEIWTDQYGRVLVKFHWDLSDTKDDKTSCWIRVSQGWVGKSWGILFTPRIGQEVIVSFLNGDPDYPLITGCVYNGDNPPPYLPDTPTKSTIMTNSSKGGGGFNELRFEDLKDSEQIFMHAQKDLDTEVFNGNRTATIFNNEGTGGNDTLTLKKGNRTMTLNEGNETILLDKGNRSVTLTQGNETIILTQGNQATTLQQGNQDITLAAGNQTTNVTGNVATVVSGNYDLTVGGNLTLTVTGNIMIKTQANCVMDVTANMSVKAMQIMAVAQTMAGVTADTITLTGKTGVIMAAQNITGTAQAGLVLVGTATAVLQSSALAAVKAPAVMLGG
ncbi:MAG TPA: type VI secretion system tip protein VgrG [Holosporales bacterium]|nr:type VI secretion system tip protein VgrG [Holosporales bacterium]